MKPEREQSPMSGQPLPKNPLTEEQFSRLAKEAREHIQAEQESYPGQPVTENEIRLSQMD